MRGLTKLIGYLRLDGKRLIDKIYVHRAKLCYCLCYFIRRRCFQTSIGFFLSRDGIVKNSYGKFYCRKKDGLTSHKRRV